MHDVKSGQSVLCTIKELTPCYCHMGDEAVASREEREEVQR